MTSQKHRLNFKLASSFHWKNRKQNGAERQRMIIAPDKVDFYRVSIRIYLSFCIIAPSDWPKNLALLCYPIRSKTKTRGDLLAHVFPHFASATGIYFEF